MPASCQQLPLIAADATVLLLPPPLLLLSAPRGADTCLAAVAGLRCAPPCFLLNLSGPNHCTISS